MLFEAFDESLKRHVSLRVNFFTDEPTRAWFLREGEALGQLDHPSIRHVYDTGIVGDLAYRVGNWIEGEGLEESVQRGPRMIPSVSRSRETCWARSSTPTSRESSSAASFRQPCSSGRPVAPP